jgi:FAD/FMN-containing dehydrogenase
VSPGVAGELSGVPPLDGVLLTSPDALAAAAEDFGHSAHRPPAAVLRPGSPNDVAAILRCANEQGLQVACRGRGHATGGQAQAFLRVPDGDVCFLFDILRTAPPDPAAVEAALADNRRLFEAARDAGGLRYCVGSVPFTTEDWRRHFGAHWPAFERAKRTYDPANVLGPGQGIFPR